jgi:hypothetical protein
MQSRDSNPAVRWTQLLGIRFASQTSTPFATLALASGFSLQLFNGDEMHLRTAALALLITTPVAAESVQFPITIPQECFELAQREGVPTVIENKMQATKAKLKLAQMKNSDHLVRECRAAVHRAQQAMAAQAGTPARSQGAQPGFHGGFEAGAQAAEARSQNHQP